MRYTTLGNDVLDTSDYSIIATAKTEEIADNIVNALNIACFLNTPISDLTDEKEG